VFVCECIRECTYLISECVILIYTYDQCECALVFVGFCVCVCVREREREREIDCARVRVSVFVRFVLTIVCIVHVFECVQVCVLLQRKKLRSG